MFKNLAISRNIYRIIEQLNVIFKYIFILRIIFNHYIINK